LNTLINHEYKLPEEPEVNTDENDEIFDNYAQFRHRKVSEDEQEDSE
jgi:hypothetical protein